MKLLFLGKAIDEASSRYRLLPLMAALDSEQHQCEFKSSELSLLAKLKLLLEAGQYDVLVIQRKLFAPWFVRALRRKVPHLVFDFDDAIFSKSSGHASTSRMVKFEAICQCADVLLAGNDYLAKAAQDAGADPARVQTIPTSVVLEEAVLEEIAPLATPREARPPTLVWIGSSSTRRYLDFLTPALERLGQQFPDLTLKVISDFQFHLDAMEVNNVPWSLQTEAVELASSDIGIAPMIDDPWTRGKCALKVLQYMAAGLPVVSSRCGANEEAVIHAETGYLVDSEEDWCQAVGKLLNDVELAQQLGQAGRRRVAQYYERQTVVEKTLELLLGR